MQKLPYQNPGKLFIERFGVPRDIDDVVRYADFLRQEAGVGDRPPIDLTKISSRFGIKSQQAPLVDQQGTSDGLWGFMLIKEDDPATRQRFSEAHELIEFLFHQIKACRNGDNPTMLRITQQRKSCAKKVRLRCLCHEVPLFHLCWGMNFPLNGRQTWRVSTKHHCWQLFTGCWLKVRMNVFW